MDGIVSAAIVKSSLLTQGIPSTNITVWLVNYHQVHRRLKTFRTRYNQATLYLTDLGLNSEVIAELKNFPPIQPGISPRYYFDHHEIHENAKILQLEKIFSLFQNATIHSRYQGKDWCTADMVYEHFQITPSSHLTKLRKFAHIMDYRSDKQDPRGLASKVLSCVNYYQQSDKNLRKLVDLMVNSVEWQEFLKNLPLLMQKVKKWLVQQNKLIHHRTQIEHYGNYTIIHSFADIRSGQITRELQKKHPEADIYLGLSLQQEYINIRMNSKYPFAYQIASLYGGGGHPDRAGVDVPDHVKHYLDKQISPIQIPSEFIAEILTYFQQLAEEEKKQ